MIKTLYKEKCLRYFIIPEIILLFIFFFKFSILVYIILPLYVIESIFDNIFFNIPLIWLLFKITTMYFCSIKFEKINKIEDEEKKKKEDEVRALKIKKERTALLQRLDLISL